MAPGYLETLQVVSTPLMMVAMLVATLLAGLAGAAISRRLFARHFERAGLV